MAPSKDSADVASPWIAHYAHARASRRSTLLDRRAWAFPTLRPSSDEVGRWDPCRGPGSGFQIAGTVKNSHIWLPVDTALPETPSDNPPPRARTSHTGVQQAARPDRYRDPLGLSAGRGVPKAWQTHPSQPASLIRGTEGGVSDVPPMFCAHPGQRETASNGPARRPGANRTANKSGRFSMNTALRPAIGMQSVLRAAADAGPHNSSGGLRTGFHSRRRGQPAALRSAPTYAAELIHSLMAARDPVTEHLLPFSSAQPSSALRASGVSCGSSRGALQADPLSGHAQKWTTLVLCVVTDLVDYIGGVQPLWKHTVRMCALHHCCLRCCTQSK